MTKAANLAAVGSVVTAPTGSAPSYQCRAWVNFDGTGTVAIRSSGNVSSITDNGVGDYTLNFTTAMIDANYTFVGTCNYSISGNQNQMVAAPYNQAPTTTTIRIACSNGSNNDQLYVYGAIFR